MTIRLGRLAVAIAFGLICVTANSAIVQAAEETVSISGLRSKLVTAERGKPLTIRTDRPYYEVVIGDPDIATVHPLTNQSFYVLGHAAGTTGIAFFDENQRVAGSIDLEVSVDTTRLRSSIHENVPDADIEVRTTNGQIVLSGEAPDQVSADMAQQIASRFAGDEEDVLNSVRITSSQQVQLNVRFVEVNRNAGKELGVSIRNISYGSPGLGSDSGVIGFDSPGGNFFGQLISGGLNVDVAIKAMEERGLARRLAEPNLVTRSGERANFLAGGEFPIVVTDNDGNVTIQYKKFGVGLEFMPTVLKDGLISLEIEPEVSSIDRTYSFQFPVFLVRRARTSIDLKSGQSFMIAGLFQADNERGADQIPGVGRLPVIGALFSSRQFQRRETDLVMIVTPHLVRPIEPGTPTKTPLDNNRPATDTETVMLGIDEVHTAAARGGVQPAPRNHGHLLTIDATASGG